MMNICIVMNIILRFTYLPIHAYTHDYATHSRIHEHWYAHTHSNIAEALISKGLATCLRHRQDDDQRSSCYDDLLAAEARAVKNTKGVHSKKEAPIHRVADVSQVSRNLIRGWGAQGFCTPEVDSPSLEFLKCTWRIVLQYYNYKSEFPLLRNRLLIISWMSKVRGTLMI